MGAKRNMTLRDLIGWCRWWWDQIDHLLNDLEDLIA